MNRIRERALFNPKAHTSVLKEISFENDMTALMLDMSSTEIPHKGLFGASQHTRDLFDLLVFCSQMFEAREIPNDLYLIQKQYLVPGDLLARAQLSTGYVLLALFSKGPFEENFPLICRSVIALNNGHLSLEEALATDMDFESLTERILDMNARMGTFKCSKGKRRRHESIVGSFSYTHDFDATIEKYHYYLLPDADGEQTWATSIASEMCGSDLSEAWLYRASLLSPAYTFKKSCRMTGAYRNLLQLADLVCPGRFSRFGPYLNSLQGISAELPKQDVVADMFRQYLKMYEWHKVFREESGTWKLDLRDQVAWKMEQSHKLQLKFFHGHNFYTIYSGGMNRAEETLEDLAPQAHIDSYTKRIWQETIHQLFDPDGSVQERADMTLHNRFACLYPAMSNLKILFSNFARVLKTNGQISRCYQNPHFGRFFLSVYDDVMKGNIFAMGEARKVQYRNRTKLFELFSSGCLNGMQREEVGEPMLFSSRLLVHVEPTQDVMANQLLLVASLCGICHLSTEFFLCLFSNILSFTTRKEKPMIVLDGPTGAGKSYMAHCCQAVVVGSDNTQNNYACVDEHYATTRSHTVSLENPYCSVLGQRLIEEWQSGSGNNNPYMDNVSLESVTMKNAFDHGMSCSQRCKTVKNRNKEERIVRSVEFALTDRSTIILANGFRVCSSIEERCMVYHIPDLTAKVAMVPRDQLQTALDHYKIPQFFSLMRYLITEQYNRDALGMSLKYSDHDNDLDQREIDLTFSRLEQVLDAMGLSSRTILTHRRKIQIMKFAELLAHWRAVVEVYGSLHPDCQVEHPDPDQTFEEYNHYLVRCMTNHLGQLAADEKDKRLAARIVIDPSDILSATTLVVQFDKSDKRLLRILCCHLAEPDRFEEVEPWSENYLVIENVTIRRICDELKKQSLPILKEFLGHSLAVLEDTMLKNNVPYIIRRFDNTGINKHREKDMQQFCLLVNAAHAATIYAQENDVSVRQLTTAVAEHLARCAKGDEECHWGIHQGQLRGLRVSYVKMVVPIAIARTCAYLYHLPIQPKPFRWYEVRQCPHDSSLGEVEVNVDFGWCRLRALQSMLREHLSNQDDSSSDQLANEFGFLVLPIKNRQLFTFPVSYAKDFMVSDGKANSLVRTEHDGSLMVHVAIFSKSFKSRIVQALRNKVVKCCLRKGQLAERSYFKLSWNESQEFHQTRELLVAKVSNFSCKADSFFKMVDNALHVHVALLNLIPSIKGITDEEVNVGRLLVENALCKNMTDQSTVMVFDRDKVYKTQNLTNAISFVNVRDVALKMHDGALPDYWCDDADNRRMNARIFPFAAGETSSDIVQEINAHENEGKVTFHPDHRLRKLALKLMLKENTLAMLFKERTDLTVEPKRLLEDHLKEHMKREYERKKIVLICFL